METALRDADTPPRTLEQLRRLVAQIHKNEASTKLGGRALRALQRIVNAPGQMAMSSISEVAASAGVNASTLTRLSRRLGYRGFNEFQDVFRQHLYGSSRHASERAGDLPRAPAAQPSPEAILARIARNEARNIASTAGYINAGALETAAGWLTDARRVRTFGTRQMHAVAYLLSYGLGMLRSDVSLLAPFEHDAALGLAQLDIDDVVVVVSCAPYTRASIETARTAVAQGMRVIALTDSRASPLATVAGLGFVCETGDGFFGGGSAALFVVADALLSVVAERMGTRGLQQRQRREALISEMGVDL